MKLKNIAGIGALLLATLTAAQATNSTVAIPPGMIAVFKAGTSDTNFPMATARVAPCYVQVFDPSMTNAAPVISVSMSTNASVPGSVWINHHAGSEGGGISRSIDRSFLALEGYVGNIIPATAAKPSTDPTVNRGIVTLDAFTNAVSVYSDLHFWFGIPIGAPNGTQDNPTGIAALDTNNFYGTGNFSGKSQELDGTLYYNPTQNIDEDPADPYYNGKALPVEVQNYLQGAYEARIIGGTLYVAGQPSVGGNSGVYNFIDNQGNLVPLPQSLLNPTSYNGGNNGYTYTNLFINWGTKFIKVANFDMNPQATIAYGADQTYGIIKFTNNGGVWQQAPYFFNATNIGTTAQVASAQGCFGICVNFSGSNPVIYATTMENGCTTNYPGGFPVNSKQGHANNNRLIKIVDTGVNPGNSLVAQTLAVATTTNEFFGGIDFSPDLRPLIASNPANYNTTTNGIAPFSVSVASSPYSTNYQWYANGSTLLAGQTNATLFVTNSDFTYNNYTYQCVITNAYGAVTSTPALLVLTASPVPPVIISGTNYVTAYVGNNVTFAPVIAINTQPFSYQWYVGGQPLSDGANPNNSGSGYVGSQTASLTVTNIQFTDATNYWVVVSNTAGYASNLVDVLTVTYHPPILSYFTPASVTTLLKVPVTLACPQQGGTLPITNTWYACSLTPSNTIATSYPLTGSEYTGATNIDNTGTGPNQLTIAANTLTDATNYYCVVSNPYGSVTSVVATVTILMPPPPSAVTYSNQLYLQTFDALPDPGTQGSTGGVAVNNGLSVNSINNPMDPGSINGVAYSLANPFDFAFPVIVSSYVGGLGLTNSMPGWYGAAATKNTGNPSDYAGVDGITRFGAQAGDQSTGGVIDFGPNDQIGGLIGTNRALGLLTTGTTGPTTFAVKLTNNSPNTLNYLNLSFIGELWRQGGQPRTMSFGYTVDNTATNFTLTSDSINTATPVPSLSFSFATTNNGGPYAMDGTQLKNQTNLSVTNLLLTTPWTNGGALWLIWSLSYNGQGSGNGYAIDNLAVNATTNLVAYTVPIVSDLGPTNITVTNAMLSYGVNPNNWPITYAIYYGTSSNPATNGGLLLAFGALPAGNISLNFSNVATGLLPGTVYHYQIVANNFAGSSVTPDNTFTTAAGLPTASTGSATAIGINSALFNATINPQGAALAYWFNYGATTNYGSSTATNNLAAGITSSVSVSNLVMGLTSGTTNHYQIVVSGIPGIVLGSDKSFVTLANAPAVVTAPATPVYGTAATLNGTVNPQFGAGAYWFAYGTNSGQAALTNLTTAISLGVTNAVLLETTNITELLTNTTYYFQIVATNNAGTNMGGVLSFTTSNVITAPVVQTLWATNVLGTTAGLVGSVYLTNDAVTCWFVYGTNQTTAFTNISTVTNLPASNSKSTNTIAISGLFPNTTYYYAIGAYNTAGTNYGATNSFATSNVISAPVVVTLPATNVFGRSATLVGSVRTNIDAATSWWFVYGTNQTTALTNLTAPTVLVNTNNQLIYTNSSVISGLLPATTYYFAIVGINYVGTTYGLPTNSFTTATLVSQPVVTTSAASGVTSSQAVFKGTVTTTNDTATAWFIYGTNNSSAFTNIAAYQGTNVPANTVLVGITATSITSTNKTLLPNTTYYFQAVATNTAGVMGMGVTNSLTTSNQAPAVAPMVVQAITATTATLDGTVNPNNSATGYWFKYGTNITLTGTTAYSATNTLAASYSTAITGTTVTGLLPGTTYYFQVGATNAGGTNTSWNNSFTTLNSPPTATTLQASNITASAATLDGSVNPNNAATSYWFVYGTDNTISLTNYSAINTLAAVNGTFTVTNLLTGLSSGVTYYFSIVATNNFGTSVGATNSFTTVASPTVTTLAASNITASAGTLDASVNPNGGATAYWFVYGTNSTLSVNTTVSPTNTLAAGNSAMTVTNLISGLLPVTTYYYEIVATNSAGGPITGAISNFTTPPGAPAKLAITTQPAAPAVNGGALATQPVVVIEDQYGNVVTTATSNVVAQVGAGNWTLGGTTTQAGVSGTNTFANLTATSAAAVTGATISFTSGSLTGVTSTGFDIPAPVSLPPVSSLLGGVKYSGGQFIFSFTNNPGLTISVLATNVLTAPQPWPVVGTAVEGPSGTYIYTNTSPTNGQQFFYTQP